MDEISWGVRRGKGLIAKLWEITMQAQLREMKRQNDFPCELRAWLKMA
jgi:hypothetical protein